jgi:hypothetical protein
LKIFPKELQFDKLINWKNIGYEVVGKTNDGKEKKDRKLSTMKPNFDNYCSI